MFPILSIQCLGGLGFQTLDFIYTHFGMAQVRFRRDNFLSLKILKTFYSHGKTKSKIPERQISFTILIQALCLVSDVLDFDFIFNLK